MVIAGIEPDFVIGHSGDGDLVVSKNVGLFGFGSTMSPGGFVFFILSSQLFVLITCFYL